MKFNIGIGKNIAANYLKGIESVGGFLHFEEDSLVFKSHPFNIQRGTTCIKYSEIDHAESGKAPISEYLSVFTKEGVEHKFIVLHIDDIIAFINTMVQRQSNTPSAPQAADNSSAGSTPTDKDQKFKEDKKN